MSSEYWREDREHAKGFRRRVRRLIAGEKT